MLFYITKIISHFLFQKNMEKSTNFRQLLGMKQEDMAMLLQITISQWAMYATGKRSLPIAAKLKLAEMLKFSSQNEKKGRNNLEIEKNQNIEIEKHIAQQQILNTELQFAINKKLLIVSKKYETALKALNFIEFLETKQKNFGMEYEDLLNVIKQNTETEIEKNSLLVQTKLEMKLELLKFEEKVLNRKNKK
jgi:transcriptional regulator with XRE-family HTH domain